MFWKETKLVYKVLLQTNVGLLCDYYHLLPHHRDPRDLWGGQDFLYKFDGGHSIINQCYVNVGRLRRCCK